MKTKTVIVQASSRSEGNTKVISDYLRRNIETGFIDLTTKKIKHFDYSFKNQDDDFFPLIKELNEYDYWILATPVYWYSMSGRMKVFFDRLSDLLKIHKETGRQLRGKSMGIISCSGHDDVDNSFEVPFKLSAEYLGMNYIGHLHGVVQDNEISPVSLKRLNDFIDLLKSFPG